jgi:chitinase
MSYDLMNRRDNVTRHHTSVADSDQVIQNYLAIGAPAEKMNRTSQPTLTILPHADFGM